MNNFNLYEVSRHTNTGIIFVGLNTADPFPLHWHEHLEFHFIVRGYTSIQCGGQIFECREQDCLIINSNELHKGIDTENSTSFKFKLHPSFFDHKHYVFQNLIHDDTVTSIMLRIMDIYQNTDDASVYILKGYIFHLIGYLCTNFATKVLLAAVGQHNAEKLERMNQVASYLHTHYRSPISAEMLAKMSHYTYSYFSHSFKDVFGVSATNYLANIRIEKAKTLLTTTDMNITEIAESSGFSDSNYLARVFKKATGLSPLKYREAHRLTGEERT